MYTSFSPNTRAKDLGLNIKLLLSPRNYLKGKYPDLARGWFEKKYFGSKAYTFNYARSGMYILFKSLGLNTGNEILVQGFTCSAAVNPAIWAGLHPVFVDINVDTGNMDMDDLKNKYTKKARAVMFQHTFGNSTGIDEALNFCKENGLILIEDCTNTIMGKHDGKLIGSFGEASIFSFGRDKAVSGVNGGVILLNTDKFLDYFEKNLHNLEYPGIYWTFKELLYPVLWQIIKSSYSVGFGKAFHLLFTKLGLLTRASTIQEKLAKIPESVPKQLPNSLANLAFFQLQDVEELNNHRIKINDVYSDGLSGIQEVRTFTFNSDNIPLRYPLLVKDKDKLLDYLAQKNILVGDWYDKPVTPFETSLEKIGYYAGVCKTAELVCGQIINLPNHINIDKEEAKRIVSVIEDFYGNYKN
jgi:dTDP-4-amino-4,6-dideoxygalactose transaminase